MIHLIFFIINYDKFCSVSLNFYVPFESQYFLMTHHLKGKFLKGVSLEIEHDS